VRNILYPFIFVVATVSLWETVATAQNVVAHRGYHLEDGCPENSIASLKASQRIGVYGSEFDIWLTKDGKVMICHNAAYESDPLKRKLKESDYRDLKRLKLANGEKVPTFEAYVKQAKKGAKGREVPTKLICEMKDHGSDSLNQALFAAAYGIIRKYGMEDMIVWQSFNLRLCSYAAGITGNHNVVCICTSLNNLITPTELNAAGVSGANYGYRIYDAHPEFIDQLHSFGMTAGLCAEDDMDIIRRMVASGVDTIGTNRPLDVLSL